MYTEKQLVAVAKRENNTKRNYLVVEYEPFAGEACAGFAGRSHADV